jgi:hypothetical protein
MIKLLENTYALMIKSRMTTQVEICGLEEGYMTAIHTRHFVTKANEACEGEFERMNRNKM